MKQYIVYWLLVRLVSTAPEPQYDQWGRQVIQESNNTSWLTLSSSPVYGFKTVKEQRKKVFYNADSAYAFYGRSKAIEVREYLFTSTAGSVDSVRIDSISRVTSSTSQWLNASSIPYLDANNVKLSVSDTSVLNKVLREGNTKPSEDIMLGTPGG